MEKNKKSSIILALILLSFFILIFLIVALIFLKLDSDNNNSNQIQNIVSDEESSIPYEPNLIDVLKEHNTEFLSQDGNTVYVSFDKDLYSSFIWQLSNINIFLYTLYTFHLDKSWLNFLQL